MWCSALSRLWLTVLLIIAGWNGVSAAHARGNTAQGPDIGAEICEQAAEIAAAESGVPPDILGALTLTETGRRRDGVLRPWAWSVNAEGAGQWFNDPASALRFAQERALAGRPNMDIGCFQINYRWHGQHFRSVAEMFDPLANARYAARFVRENYQESGDWRTAAGAFHSKTPQYANRYLARFDQLRAQFRQRGFAGMTGTPGTYNRFSDDTGAPDRLPDPAELMLPRDALLAEDGSGMVPPAPPGEVVTLDDPDALAALDRMVALSEGGERRRVRVRDRSMLLGAAPGTAAMGGGSLAALGQRGPILASTGQPLITGGSRALPGLPEARDGPPASASSLWQMAQAADEAASRDAGDIVAAEGAEP